MSNFEDKMTLAIKDKIISEIQKIDLIKMDYRQKSTIPQEFINQIWDSLDWDEIIEQIKPQIETRICNSIVAGMETEVKTDIKKLLSVDGVRQKLRMEVYPKLMKVLNDETV